MEGPCGTVFFVQRPDLDGSSKGLNPKKKAPKTKKLTLKLLRKGDDQTSAAVIAAFKGNETFKAFAKAEMQGIIEKKEAKLRHTQQLALAALLKRIQRDRNE